MEMLEQAADPALYQSAGGLDDMKEALKYAYSWQEALVTCDAQLIWERIYGLLEKTGGDEMMRAMRTQELFLQILNEGRIHRYIKEELTDPEIEEDLISQLAIS
ncbi:MAG TPA: hypothetical protein VID27_20960 [Blastocatellia bacterium]|jgi:hypothetical protein